MPRVSALSDPEIRESLLATLRGGTLLDDACKALDFNRAVVTRYRKQHPDFAEQLDDAYEAGRIARSLPRHHGAALARVEREVDAKPTATASKWAKVDEDGVAGSPLAQFDDSPEGFVAKMEYVVTHYDPDSRAWSTAANILERAKLGSRYVRDRIRAQHEAEGEVGDDRRKTLVVRVPRREDRGVIDAEVVG